MLIVESGLISGLVLFASTMSNSECNDPEGNQLPEKVTEMQTGNEIPKSPERKRIVVVGLGMVGIAFMCVATALWPHCTHDPFLTFLLA